MKYYLIKANDKQKTKFVGEYYFDLAKEPIELTEEELLLLMDWHCHAWGNGACDYDDAELFNKIIKVLDNEKE